MARDSAPDLIEVILSRIDKISDKVDVVQTDIVDIKIKTTENSIVLSEHTRRSTASENRLTVVENKLVNVYSYFSAMSWVYKGLAAVGVLASTILAVLKIMGK